MRRARGFSLLEVMVAVAILGMSLTVILSAQVGLFSSGGQGQRMSVAIGLGRCKMTELEEQFLKMGYPEVDTTDEGSCCNDDGRRDFSCAWKIERVELPPPPTTDPFAAASSSGGSAFGSAPGGGLGALGALAGNSFGADAGIDPSALSQLAPGAVPNSGTGGLADMLTSGGSTGVGGIAPMLFSMVYPSIKPMLESSVRKVTVTVKWRDGLSARELEVLQWVTSPTRGGFLSDVVDSAGGLGTGMGLPGAAPTGGSLPSGGTGR